MRIWSVKCSCTCFVCFGRLFCLLCSDLLLVCWLWPVLSVLELYGVAGFLSGVAVVGLNIGP